MKNWKLKVGVVATSAMLSSCFTVIRPGEVGLKQSFGIIKDKTLYPGAHGFNFFYHQNN